jgi:hypothetical protein
LAETLFKLFDEYAVRYARGEHPDPVAYLDQAGEEAGELARMLDAFLQWAPPPTLDAASVLLMQAWIAGDPPLRELRVQRGMRVDDVAADLTARLGIDVGLTGKLRRYFQRLERGSLDVACVDHRVFEALAIIFQTTRAVLVSWANAPRSDGPAAAPAYRSDREPTVAPAVPLAEGEDWDEVDQLFLGRQAGA